AVIGEAAATAGSVNGKAHGAGKVFGLRAGAGREERGVFDEPDKLGRFSRRDCRRAGLHFGHCVEVIHRRGRNPPFHGRAGRGRMKRGEGKAVVNHSLTIAVLNSCGFRGTSWHRSLKSSATSPWCSAPRPCPSTRCCA